MNTRLYYAVEMITALTVLALYHGGIDIRALGALYLAHLLVNAVFGVVGIVIAWLGRVYMY